VTGSSSTVRSICVRSSARMSVRRSSPNFFAFFQLLDHEVAQDALGVEHAAMLVALLFQPLFLVVEPHAIEARELPEAQVDDVLGLPLAETPFFGEFALGLGLVLARADELDDLVDLDEGLDAALDDVQAVLDLVEAVLRPALDRGNAEFGPFLQHADDALGVGQAVTEAQPREVERVAHLEAGVHQQRLHHFVHVLA